MKKNFAHFENFVPQHLTRDRTMGTTDAENRVQKNIFSFKNCQTTTLFPNLSALDFEISSLKYPVR